MYRDTLYRFAVRCTGRRRLPLQPAVCAGAVPAGGALQQRARFDAFLGPYNHERPQQALGTKVSGVPERAVWPVAHRATVTKGPCYRLVLFRPDCLAR